MKRHAFFAALLTVVLGVCLLPASHQLSHGATKKEPIIFNSVKQRMEVVNELKGIAQLLREQNQLLKEQNEILRKSAARK